VLAGRVLRSDPGRRAVAQLALGGAGLVVLGAVAAPIVPLNKPLWTPSYVLLTGGIGLLLLAATHWLVDVRELRRPFRPAEILGINAIVAFVVSELLFRAVLGHVQAGLVDWLARFTTEDGAAYVYPALSVAVIWAVCAALVRRGIIVRI
jgi:predicted acyltransferase